MCILVNLFTKCIGLIFGLVSNCPFQIDKLQLCQPLIRAIEATSMKEDFSKSQLVTYRYDVQRNDYCASLCLDSNLGECIGKLVCCASNIPVPVNYSVFEWV